jgi:hypothetical protein
MENLFVLPTDKPSRLCFNQDKNKFTLKHRLLEGTNSWKSQNIYITSDEEIKVGDWFIYNGTIDGDLRTKFTVQKWYNNHSEKMYYLKDCKKIILTTDQDLINDGVQAIDDEFLEWFVKNPSCESVKIDSYKTIYHTWIYKIIIPQEEQSVQEYEQQGLEKSYSQCERETLEEVAERFYGEEEIVNDYDISGYLQSAFLTGAKWQQEPEQFFNDDRVKTLEKAIEYLLKKQEQDKKMYSELSLFLEKEADKDRLKSLTSNQIRTLIEQFKKK